MSNLYNTLCVVRTSILNVVGQVYLSGKQKNIPALLKSIGDEINEHIDFVEELFELSEEQLIDLGFDYLDNESDLMLIPVWLYPFIPHGTELVDINDNVFTLDDDTQAEIYNDNWVNAGILCV